MQSWNNVLGTYIGMPSVKVPVKVICQSERNLSVLRTDIHFGNLGNCKTFRSRKDGEV